MTLPVPLPAGRAFGSPTGPRSVPGRCHPPMTCPAHAGLTALDELCCTLWGDTKDVCACLAPTLAPLGRGPPALADAPLRSGDPNTEEALHPVQLDGPMCSPAVFWKKKKMLRIFFLLILKMI